MQATYPGLFWGRGGGCSQEPVCRLTLQRGPSIRRILQAIVLLQHLLSLQEFTILIFHLLIVLLTQHHMMMVVMNTPLTAIQHIIIILIVLLIIDLMNVMAVAAGGGGCEHERAAGAGDQAVPRNDENGVGGGAGVSVRPASQLLS
jgi:hypothetical protein